MAVFVAAAPAKAAPAAVYCGWFAGTLAMRG